MSVGPNLKYIKKIEEQQELIEFLKQQYKTQTGYEAKIPTHLDQVPKSLVKSQAKSNIKHSLLMPSTKSLVLGQTTIEEEKVQVVGNSFYDTYASLKLPHKVVSTDKKQTFKKQPITTFDVKNKFHMVEELDLCDFRGRQFTRMAFKDFVESIQEMRALHTLMIRNNGMDDSFSEDLVFLVQKTRITKLDISHNDIGPKGIEPVLEAIKLSHRFKWLNVSRNYFSHNLQTVTLLSQALVQQNDLIHCEVDAYKPPQTNEKGVLIHYRGGDTLCKMAYTHKALQSFYLVDTYIGHDGMKLLTQVLTSQAHHLVELNLKFCFIPIDHTKMLTQALLNNHSLVSLDLRHNNIDNIAGMYICDMLAVNHYLYSVNLSHNELSDSFAITLAKVLTKNNVLAFVKLGYNNIGEEGFKHLLGVLGAHNDTIEDFGNFEQNPIEIATVEEISKKLAQNKSLKTEQASTKQSTVDEETSIFKVLSPINFASAMAKKQQNFRLWKI